MASYVTLTEDEMKKLSEIAQDLFQFVYNFIKKENITNFVNV